MAKSGIVGDLRRIWDKQNGKKNWENNLGPQKNILGKNCTIAAEREW